MSLCEKNTCLTYKNNLTSTLRAAEVLHFSTQLRINKCALRKMGRNASNSDTIIHSSKKVNDTSEIATIFNRHFAEVRQSLLKDLI